MANSHIDFQTVVDTVIMHTKTCIGHGVITPEIAAEGLRITLKDLQSRNTPPAVLEQLEDYILQLAQRPEPSN